MKWPVTSRDIPEIERYLQPDSYGIKVSLEVKVSHVSRAVAAFGHACSDMLADEGKVQSFFQKHLLHWLEAMSLLERMSEAMLALQKLEVAINVSY